MQLNNLLKVTEKSKKRLGRGIGSGRGKTAARGYKGQKARGKIPASFVGGSLPLYKKLPFKRGWGNRKAGLKPMIITFADLSTFVAKSTVSIATLIEKGIIDGKDAAKAGVKILSKGELKQALIVELPVSRKVKEMIESLGGKVV